MVRERRTPLAQVRTNRRAPEDNAGERLSKRNVRIVTLPHEAVQPLTWAERHARYRANQADRSAQGRLVPRTLAQTGHPARVEQQMRPRKSLPRQRAASRVPVRSGNSRRSGGFWRRFLGFLFVLIVVVGSISFALLSPTFRVQQLDISGTQNQKLIASIRHMGIQGQDIFLLDQATLVTRLEALAPVATASLGIQLPSTVMVAVQERVPVLLWQTGKLTFGLAQDGTVIAPQSELSGTDHLALVVDARSIAGRVRPGSRINAADVVFVEQVFEQVPGIEGVAPFSLQYIDTITEGGHRFPANQAGSGSYVIVSANGWRAYLGDTQNSNSLANRLQELQQILNIAQQKNLQIATIDLRFGLHPAYTLKA
jgi:cell division septal protein FtsQ